MALGRPKAWDKNGDASGRCLCCRFPSSVEAAEGESIGSDAAAVVLDAAAVVLEEHPRTWNLEPSSLRKISVNDWRNTRPVDTAVSTP